VLVCVFNVALGLDGAISGNERQWSNLNYGVNMKGAENRSKRSTPRKKILDEEDCMEIKRFCGNLPPNSDDVIVLECVQSFKVSVNP